MTDEDLLREISETTIPASSPRACSTSTMTRTAPSAPRGR